MGAGRWVWGAGLFAGACAVGVAVSNRPELAEADRELFNAVNAGHGPNADRVFVTVTELGSMYAAGAAALTLTVNARAPAALPTWPSIVPALLTRTID